MEDKKNKLLRFNLFAFAPEPSGRFLLFATAAVMLAVHLGLFVRFALTPGADWASPFLETPESFQSLSGETLFQTLHEEFWRVSNGTLRSLGFPFFFLLMLIIAGAGGYFFHGWRIQRRGKPRRVTWQEDPAFVEMIENLSEKMGTEPPDLWMGSSPRNQGVQAFRRLGKTALRFDLGLRVLFRKKVEVFRALVLHEISHEPNKCLSLAYGVQSLWNKACAWIIYPLLIGVFVILVRNFDARSGADSFFQNPDYFFKHIFPTAALLLLQVLGSLSILGVIRSGFFRARAFWADARSRAAGGLSGLEEVFSRNLLPWSRERLEALRDPSALFRISYDLPFWAGFLSSFVAGAVSLLMIPVALGISTAILNFGARLADLAKSSPDDLIAMLMILSVSFLFLAQILLSVLMVLMPLLATGYLIARTLGRQIQRASAVELAEGKPAVEASRKLWPYAALVSIGMEAGFLFTPYALYFPRTFEGFIFLIPWFGAVTELVWLCLTSIRFFSRQLLGKHTGSFPPRRKSAFITGSSSLFLGAVLIPMFAARALIVSRVEAMAPVEILFFLCLAIVTALICWGVCFAGVSVFIPLKFSWTPSRCPSCASPETRKGSLLGENCNICGEVLCSWILLETGQPNASQKALKDVPDEESSAL